MNARTDNIRITCPHCKVVLETDSNIEGSHVECPECGKEFVAHRVNPTIVDSIKPHSKKKSNGDGKGLFTVIVKIVAALLLLHQIKVCVVAYSNQSNPEGNRFLTADGHRKTKAVPGLKTFSVAAYGACLIPGTGPFLGLLAIGLGYGADWQADVVQQHADEQWAKSQHWLKEGGIDPNKPFGRYGN